MARFSILLILLISSIHASYANEEIPLYHIAIIDRFYPPLEGFESEADKNEHLWMYGVVDIDHDYRKEQFYHGDIVQFIASAPNFVFLRYPITGQQSPMREIYNALTSINDRFEKAPIHSLILSWESSTLISAFETPLSTEHREQYINTIQQWGQSFPGWHDTYLVIRALESLTQKGANVFTIAGNSGPRTINTLSFAKGVTTVGASERELNYFITDNVFVDTYEQAAYQLTRIDDEQGMPLGYDIDGDGCNDIPISALSSQNFHNLPSTLWPPIKGSSYAAPMALKKTLQSGATMCQS